MNKHGILSQTVDIAKEHARSGNTRNVEVVLREVYAQLSQLAEDADRE